MKDLRVAGSFLTRVPMHVEGTVEVPRATPWFPVVGLGIGAAGASVLARPSRVPAARPGGCAALVVTALITGAFHHDGLADIADAFGGGWDRGAAPVDPEGLPPRHLRRGEPRARRPRPVERPRRRSRRRWAAAGLIAAHVLGRTAILGVLLVGPPAAREGLGTDYAAGLRQASGGRRHRRRRRRWSHSPLGLWVVVAVAIVAAGCGLVHELARRKIGGFTGDVLGAAEQVGEALVLLTVAAVATAGHLPWWAR